MGKKDRPASWHGVRPARRHAVSRQMIERVAERRRAGDWRGACAAAGLEVTFDLDEIRREHGAETAGAVTDDLMHLAPDLVRWHLPRGEPFLLPGRQVILAEHGPLELSVSTTSGGPAPARILLHCRPSLSAQVRLRRGDLDQDWTGLRQLWDLRCLDGLREWYGCSDRVPFLRPDGTPLSREELPAAPGPDDLAALTEWTAALSADGRLDDALTAVGVEPVEVSAWDFVRHRLAHVLSLDPVRLARTVRGLPGGAIIGRDTLCAARIEVDGGRLRLKALPARGQKRDLPWLAEAAWRRPPDLDLLWRGDIVPEDLHPLIYGVLFPGREPARPPGPPEVGPPPPVRVRCRDGAWHQVRFRDGRLRMPHDEEELRREEALRAFGGEVIGCFTVPAAWRGARGRLPRELRRLRSELIMMFRNGDTDGALSLLDHVDPRTPCGDHGTLLHLVHLVDHERVLPRLLDAGLDPAALDALHRTPLLVALTEDGSPRLIEAFLDAGAPLHSAYGGVHREIVESRLKRDLGHLRDRIEPLLPSPGRTG
ncbi:ankyrin repeat domain-containing protein [Thermomonospora cellulosilytica]|uniref:Ankyrin repeat domain-containing protein n=1 Tax=Thermomonospora cellulosilytica TaxID=1411118 RepID=A0A7W3R947_9ACTN|nr:ankyrin repeat domain-containing protein [Thermomonospora cellulosilytica]MBA9004963.1 hypothetical protein [Thermomonospora cellulosilytica]